VEELMSSYRPDSDVGRLNARGADGPVAVSAETMAVLRRAVEISELTEGAFDVTYAPLRALWRRAEKADTPPEEEELQRTLALVGHRGLSLGEGTASLAARGIEVDLGGIAKGYGIDRAAEAMMEAGAESGIVDVGADLRLFGRPPERKRWRVEVRRPPGFAERMVLKVGPCAVTTSGDYARFFSVGEQRVSHIIDPRTGLPVRNVPSVTVVAEDATTADALATAFTVMGPAAAVRLADELSGVECMLLVRRADGPVRRELSRGFAALLEG
jgi:thiamine biosynthesis lipoprotein